MVNPITSQSQQMQTLKTKEGAPVYAYTQALKTAQQSADELIGMMNQGYSEDTTVSSTGATVNIYV